MANNLSDDRDLVGILIPQEWEVTTAALTQAGPIPGVPAPSATNIGRLQVSATGTPEDADEIRMTVSKGGVVAPTGAQVQWENRNAGSIVGTKYGWDSPTAISYVENVRWETAGPNEPYYYRYSGVSLADGRVMVAAILRTSTTDTSVQVRFRSVAGVWGSWLEIDDYTSDYVYRTVSALQRPDGTIEVYAQYEEDTNYFNQVRKWVGPSDSSAAEDFEVEADTCLKTVHDAASADTWKRMKVAYGAGQWLMVVEISTELVTWASRDGAYYEPVAAVGSGVASRLEPDVTYSNGYFHVASKDGTTPYRTQYIRLGSAFDDPTQATETELETGTLLASATAAITSLEDGTLVSFSRSAVDTWNILYSVDNGGSWTEVTNAYDFDGVEAWERIDVIGHRGQILVVHDHDDNAANDHSLWLTALGGWSQLTMPYQVESNPDPLRRLDWDYSWIPIADLDAGTTWAKSGTATVSTANGVMNIAGSAGSTAIFQLTYGAPYTLARAAFAVNGGRGDLELFVGTYAVAVRVDYTAQTILLYDRNAAATVGSSDSYTQGDVLDVVMIADSSGSASAYYRVRTAANHDARAWTLLASSTTLTSGASSTRVRFIGQQDGSATTQADVDLYEIHAKKSKFNPLINGLSASLIGRPLSTKATYLHDGVSVRASGRASGGDHWDIVPDYEYAFEHCLPTVEPSPRTGWRSTAGQAQEIVALEDKDNPGESRWIESPLWGLYLDKHNLIGIKVELNQAGVGYTTIADLSTEGALAAFAGGANETDINTTLTIKPESTGTAAEKRWFRRNELAGGQAYDPNTDYSVGITGNSEGPWIQGSTTSAPVAVVYVDDNTGLTAGDVDLIPDRCLLLLYVGAHTDYVGWRLTFTAQPNRDGTTNEVHKIGTLALGPVQVLGWRPDQQRSRVLELGTIIEEADDGRTYERRIRPDRQRVEMAWTRPSPAHEEYAVNLDYVTVSGNAAGSDPVAARFVGANAMHGIVEQLGRKAFVYIPKIPQDAGSADYVMQHLDEAGLLVQYVPDQFRRETVHTDPGSGETVRTSVVTLREIV